ncbi:hypothetical protein EC968_000340 [Mortierella alpina]|nr:hypothetical protein EC968_000340 [Mortierella alpina]
MKPKTRKGSKKSANGHSHKANGTTNGVEPSTVKNNAEDSGLSKAERRFMSSTSMETEYIEALYSNLSKMDDSTVPVQQVQSRMHFVQQQQPGDMPPNSSSESDGLDYEDADSYDDHGEDGDCEDFDEGLDVYEHDEFLSSQEAILMELRREQVEFEENVRQLQQQLQRQGSLLPQSSNEAADFEKMAHCDPSSDYEGEVASPVEEPYLSHTDHHLPAEFLQRSAVVSGRSSRKLQHAQAEGSGRGPAVNSHTAGLTVGGQDTLEPVPIRHMYRGTTPPPPAIIYPLPPNAPYKFGRKASEFLEPVGEFHEFQSAEGNSRQPPFQTPLTLAAGGGSVLGSTVNMNVSSSARPVPSKDHTPTHRPQHGHNSESQSIEQSRISCDPSLNQTRHHDSQDPYCRGHADGSKCGAGERDRSLQDTHLETSTQGRLLRLIRAIQMVEKGIIARHLKYLFPTLYEKYHGLQFGTPRLFDAVATVALAMDVSPRLHHDKAHTKHGFCWIIACGDFVGGDLCIPQLGKRVVMRPGTVVAIRSTVVAYYLERYAKNTSMYVVYAYTSDNNWPPAV